MTQITSEISAAFTDSAYDGGMIEIAVNSGAWTRITPTPGYNKTFRWRAGGTNPYTGPVAGSPCLAGSITTWTSYNLDLSAYEGSNVQLRFRFGSDAGSNQEGWYVDDVVGVGYTNPTIEAPTDLTVYYESSTDELVFNWTGTAGSYQLLSATDVAGPFNVIEGTTSNTTISIPLPVGDELYYVVVAVNGVAISNPSMPIRSNAK
ncbi:MAG: immune inhibitor A [bacterium]|nr:immune inhibitor A [bacterium]